MHRIGTDVLRNLSIVDLVDDDDVVEVANDVDIKEPSRKRMRAPVILNDSSNSITSTSSSKAKSPNKRSSASDDLSDSLRSKIKQSITCTVCMEIFHRPVAQVPCGHVLCGGCFSEWFKTKNTCVLCRTEVNMVIDAPSNLTTIVEEYLNSYPEDKRSAQSIRHAQGKDTVKRGITLRSSAGTNNNHAQRNISLNDAIRNFMDITGATYPVAREYLETARLQGNSVQHAVNAYFAETG